MVEHRPRVAHEDTPPSAPDPKKILETINRAHFTGKGDKPHVVKMLNEFNTNLHFQTIMAKGGGDPTKGCASIKNMISSVGKKGEPANRVAPRETRNAVPASAVNNVCERSVPALLC